MNRIQSHFEEIKIIGKLADLKEQHYHNTLVLTAIIDLLEQKGIVTREEISARTAQLDKETIPHLRHPMR